MRRIAIALVVGMLVVSGIGPGLVFQSQDASPVNSVKAQEETGECHIDPVTGKEVCDATYGSLGGQTTEEVWLSMHVQSEAMHDHYERYTVETASMSNMTTGMQTEEGTVAFIQAYNENGGDVASAKAEAYKEVNDMASGWQQSIANKQTKQAEQARVMKTEAEGTTNLAVGDVFVGASNLNFYLDISNGTTTLFNGTEINVTRLGIIDDHWHNNEPKDDRSMTYYDGDWEQLNETIGDRSQQNSMIDVGKLNIRGPESVDGETIWAMDGQRAKATLEIIDSNRKTAIDNVGAFGDSFAATYEPGEVQAEEFMSPSYRMTEHSTDFDSTGHYSYLMFAAQDRGMSVDIGTAFTVDYQQHNETSGELNGPSGTIDGGLYASPGTFPNGSIESGVQYNIDPTNTGNGDKEISGDVWLIEGSTSEQTKLNGTFEITEMRDVTENGSVINSTTMQDNTFATTDAEGFKQDVQNWSEEWERQQNVTSNYNVTWPDAEVDISFPSLPGMGAGSSVMVVIVLICGTVLAAKLLD